MFSLCTPFGEGVPTSGQWVVPHLSNRGCPHLGNWGYPHLGSWGYPILLNGGGGGYHILSKRGVQNSSQWGYPHASPNRWGTPILPMGGTLELGLDGGTPCQKWMWVPPLGLDWGSPIRTGLWVPPGLDGVPLPPLGLDEGTPSLSGDRAAERAIVTRRAVCLLRSRRRTFLFYKSVPIGGSRMFGLSKI